MRKRSNTANINVQYNCSINMNQQNTVQKQTSSKEADDVFHTLVQMWSIIISINVAHQSLLKYTEVKWNKLCRSLQKWPKIANRFTSNLLQDNVKPHVAIITLANLEDLELKLLYHSPYSTDLLPNDYHFFQNLDNFMIAKTLIQLVL